MKVLEQRDDYTSESHDIMVNTLMDELELDGYEIIKVETKYGFWLFSKNVTRIYYQ